MQQNRNIDIEQYFRISSSDRYELVREMITFIDDNNLKEFKDLMDYAMRNRFDDWFPLLCDNSAYVVQQYLKSNRHKADR
ncbi:Rep family protein [Staphylococcus aureus]|uniref:Rep family protein n=1 Tax=Staphylococcus aureus TaxID=1280 RepID=UPI000990816D|nr:Rep family protein [Staphylococcus aureus]